MSKKSRDKNSGGKSAPSFSNDQLGENSSSSASSRDASGKGQSSKKSK